MAFAPDVTVGIRQEFLGRCICEVKRGTYLGQKRQPKGSSPSSNYHAYEYEVQQVALVDGATTEANVLVKPM